MIDTILISLSVLVGIWLIMEVATLINQRLHHYIKGNNMELLLNDELVDCSLNMFDNSIITLNDLSKLHGRYLSTTGTSIIFPYYLCSLDGYDYGVLIFSKAYFTTRKKFKELRRPRVK